MPSSLIIQSRLVYAVSSVGGGGGEGETRAERDVTEQPRAARLNSLVIAGLRPRPASADRSTLRNLTVGHGTNTLNERHKISLSLF